jgi:hypothetical protein
MAYLHFTIPLPISSSLAPRFRVPGPSQGEWSARLGSVTGPLPKPFKVPDGLAEHVDSGPVATSSPTQPIPLCGIEQLRKQRVPSLNRGRSPGAGASPRIPFRRCCAFLGCHQQQPDCSRQTQGSMGAQRIMTISDLIAKLSSFPADTRVTLLDPGKRWLLPIQIRPLSPDRSNCGVHLVAITDNESDEIEGLAK